MDKDISVNKKAYHAYEIIETIEVGLVLTGPEIKGIRAGKVAMLGSYARLLSPVGVNHPELFWVGGSITVTEGDPTRSRKLLVHRQELARLIGKIQEKGLTLIPLRLYLKKGRAKLSLGLGRGKKLYDKRETLKRRDLDRRLETAKKKR
ncbi:MAG: SsrA-binding protein SmpB [Patescibacteria group bacterium]